MKFGYFVRNAYVRVSQLRTKFGPTSYKVRANFERTSCKLRSSHWHWAGLKLKGLGPVYSQLKSILGKVACLMFSATSFKVQGYFVRSLGPLHTKFGYLVRNVYVRVSQLRTKFGPTSNELYANFGLVTDIGQVSSRKDLFTASWSPSWVRWQVSRGLNTRHTHTSLCLVHKNVGQDRHMHACTHTYAHTHTLTHVRIPSHTSRLTVTYSILVTQVGGLPTVEVIWPFSIVLPPLNIALAERPLGRLSEYTA